MDAKDYTIEYCPFCNQEVVIRSHGVTACPECGKPLAPCSVCSNADCSNCPYGCRGNAQDEFKPITNPPMTDREISFAWATAYIERVKSYDRI